MCVGWGGLGCLVLAWVLLLLSIGVVSWLVDVDVARLGDNFHWFFVFECHVFMLTGLLQSLLIGFCGAAGLHIAIIVH